MRLALCPRFWADILTSHVTQLEGRKNTMEIELKERLQRRREEIRSRLEALEEPEDAASSASDLESRERELRSLNNSIQSMSKKLQGMFINILTLRKRAYAFRLQRSTRKEKILLPKFRSCEAHWRKCRQPRLKTCGQFRSSRRRQSGILRNARC